MESITSNEIISQHQRVHSMPVGNIFNHNELERSSNISYHDQNLLFGLTQVQLPIYQQDQNSLCHIELKCKVDRGFFLCERHWTCYRRNYFQITTAFTTTNCTNNQLFYLKPPSSSSPSTSSHCEQIRRFYVQVIATSSDGNRNVELIQLTAKRDKGPQRNPPMVLIHPGDGELVHHPHDTSQKTITFERLQFKSATANNGKKRASQQYYYLSIQLIAECNDSKYVIASCQSCPLVVRGRSPGHYADTLNHKHTPYLKTSSLNNNNNNNTNNKKKKQQQQQKEKEEREMEKEKEQQVSSLSIPSPSPLSIETKENELMSTVATPTIPQQQDHYTSIPSTPIITTPTIPSNHSSVFYTSSPHVRSFSANDTTWHLSSNRHHPLPSYRTTTPWDHFQMLSSSPSSTSSPHTQQQEQFAWSNDLQQQNNHQRTQSTATSFNTYNTTTSSTPSEHSSSAFQRYDFQPLSSPILLPTQQQHQQQQQQPSISSSSSSSSSSTSSTSSSSSTSLISQATDPNTTYILYPNAPHWDAFKHKTIAASYQTNDIKQ
ncbi:hypothetical protein BJ944DRAFT_250980 [Cunninghamella echinulata]|nr:hypothetical protein BJ944DRAFT_250980 [Cunninghamella echinulata]